LVRRATLVVAEDAREKINWEKRCLREIKRWQGKPRQNTEGS